MADKKLCVIVLDDYYWIEADSFSWNLMYEKVGAINPDTGKPTISRGNPSFHATLAQAIQKYIDENLRDCSDLKAVVKRIKELEASIEKVWKGIDKHAKIDVREVSA